MRTDPMHPFHCKDGGFSTAGMAVALLLTLSLLFATAQVYRVSSASSRIQNIADACALAAENEVAEFMVAVRVADAVVLTLSVTGVILYGTGVVALCVPGARQIGAKLIELARKVCDARDGFAQRASEGLDRFQRALPFISAANAFRVGRANGESILAFSVLVPAEGRPIAVGEVAGIAELDESVSDSGDGLADAAVRAEEAAKEAQEIKERAFARDCGDSPGYCMHERAERLAGLSGTENPLYSSADTWSFSVALERARSYYTARASMEAPASATLAEQENSALRKIFYRYASRKLEEGYVAESEDAFEAYFPHLPRNTEQMRLTELYTEANFPISSDGEKTIMHAWPGCPQVGIVAAWGSIAQMEAGRFDVCPACTFTASSLGSVASASTAIANGFEYHYEAVASAADEYQVARKRQRDATGEAKGIAGPLLDQVREVLGDAVSHRIDAAPPGCKGVIAMAADLSVGAADEGFSTLFVRGGHTLGIRAAVSAATLVPEATTEKDSVITALLDGFGENGGAAVGAGRIALDLWSGLLRCYGSGQSALIDALRNGLGSLPLIGPSGLGEWAASAFEESMADLGLAPADLDALKPLLVNTGHVAASDDGGFSVTFLSAKERAQTLSSSASDVFGGALSSLEASAADAVENWSATVGIALVELPFGSVTVPLTITLPASVSSAMQGAVHGAADGLRGLYGSMAEVRSWE